MLFCLCVLLCLNLSACKGREVTPEFEEKFNTETENIDDVVYEVTERMVEDYFSGQLYSYEYKCFAGDSAYEGIVYILDLPDRLTKNARTQIADDIKINDGDYVVLDYRDYSDANMQIRHSYKADNSFVRKCVLDVLLKYEEKYPSAWNRTYETMESEWYLHNFAYQLDYDSVRAMHVDLNNSDEIPYKGESEAEMKKYFDI